MKMDTFNSEKFYEIYDDLHAAFVQMQSYLEHFNFRQDWGKLEEMKLECNTIVKGIADRPPKPSTVKLRLQILELKTKLATAERERDLYKEGIEGARRSLFGNDY